MFVQGPGRIWMQAYWIPMFMLGLVRTGGAYRGVVKTGAGVGVGEGVGAGVGVGLGVGVPPVGVGVGEPDGGV
jgi:hypothetical protein